MELNSSTSFAKNSYLPTSCASASSLPTYLYHLTRLLAPPVAALRAIPVSAARALLLCLRSLAFHLFLPSLHHRCILLVNIRRGGRQRRAPLICLRGASAWVFGRRVTAVDVRGFVWRGGVAWRMLTPAVCVAPAERRRANTWRDKTGKIRHWRAPFWRWLRVCGIPSS